MSGAELVASIVTNTARAPRRWAIPLGILFVLVSLGTVLAAPLLVMAAYGTSIVELLNIGSPWVFLVVLAQAFVALLVGVLGVFFLLGKRIPAAALLLPGLLPPAAGMLGSLFFERRVASALTSPGIDSADLSRVLAQGMAESSIPGAYGFAAFLFHCLSLLLLVAFDGMTLDVRKAAPTAPLGRGVQIASAVTSVLALVISVLLRPLLRTGITALDGTAWLGFSTACLAAVWIATGMYRAQGIYPETRGALWRHAALGTAVLVALVASANVLASHAAPAGLFLTGLLGVSSADRATLIAEAVSKVHHRNLLAGLDSVLALLAFSAPLFGVATARREGIRQAGASMVASTLWGLASLGLVAGSVAGLGKSLHAGSSRWERFTSVPGLELPVVESATEPPPAGLALIVSTDRVLMENAGMGTASRPWAGAEAFYEALMPLIDRHEDVMGFRHNPVALAVDRQLPVAEVLRLINPALNASYKNLKLVVAPGQASPQPDLGAWSAGFGTDLSVVDFQICAPGAPAPEFYQSDPAPDDDEAKRPAGSQAPKYQAADMLDLVLVDEGDTGRFYRSKSRAGYVRIALGAGKDATRKRTDVLTNLRESTPGFRIRMMLSPRAEATMAEVASLLGRLQESMRKDDQRDPDLRVFVMVNREVAERGLFGLSEIDPKK